MNTEQTATPTDTQADSYEFGFVLGANQAKADDCIVDDKVMSMLALDAYDTASRSLRIEKPAFLVGYVSGWAAYLDGIV